MRLIDTRKLLLGLAAAALLAAPAHAEDRNVEIVNKTGTTIVAFYSAEADTDDWGENILDEGEVLKPDESVVIDFDDGSDECLFDLKADIPGGKAVFHIAVNVCRTKVFRFGE
jgi:hypothetical protein